MELNSLIFENHVIISNIFSHLDLPTFKSARLVAVSWNEIAKQMKLLNLQLQLTLSEPDEVFSQKVQLLQNFSIQNIIISDGEYCQFPRQKWASVEDILTQIGPQIKSIELNFSLCFKDDNIISLFKTVLKQCTNAIEFRIGIALWGEYEEIEESYKNNSIRKLCIKRTSIPKHRFRDLFQLFPNMEEIEANSVHTISKFLGEFYHPNQLDKVKVIKFSNPKKANKKEKKLSEIHFTWIRKLTNLARLEILDLNWLTSDYPHEFFNRFKTTLESLTLGLIIEREMELSFPLMARLQSLSLKFEIEAEENCKIGIKAGHFLEAENFPNLKNLKIELGLNFPTEQFISDNFGSLQNGFVRKLALIFPYEENMGKFYELANQNLLQSFPNAHLEFHHN